MPRRPRWLWVAAALVAVPNGLILFAALSVVAHVLLFGVDSLKGMSGPGIMGILVAPFPAFLILRCEWYAIVRGSRSAAAWIVGLSVYFVLLGLPLAIVSILQPSGRLGAKPDHDSGGELIFVLVHSGLAVTIGLAHHRWRRILQAHSAPVLTSPPPARPHT